MRAVRLLAGGGEQAVRPVASWPSRWLPPKQAAAGWSAGQMLLCDVDKCASKVQPNSASRRRPARMLDWLTDWHTQASAFSTHLHGKRRKIATSTRKHSERRLRRMNERSDERTNENNDTSERTDQNKSNNNKNKNEMRRRRISCL